MNKLDTKYEIDMIFYCRRCGTINVFKARDLHKCEKCSGLNCTKIYDLYNFSITGRMLQKVANSIKYPRRYKITLYTRLELDLDYDRITAKNEIDFFKNVVRKYYHPNVFRSYEKCRYIAFTVEYGNKGKVAFVDDSYEWKDCLLLKDFYVYNFKHILDNQQYLGTFGFRGADFDLSNVKTLIDYIGYTNNGLESTFWKEECIVKYILK